MAGTVYQIFCMRTGKSYIGQTWSKLSIRWKQHRSVNNVCKKLKNAMVKYGVKAFSISPLTEGLLSQEDLDSAKSYWIRYFDSISNGYNIKSGGHGGKHSADTIELLRKRSSEVSIETRIKRSISMKGKNTGPRTSDERLAISQGRKGKSSGTRNNGGMKNPMFGKKQTPESIDKNRESNRQTWARKKAEALRAKEENPSDQ